MQQENQLLMRLVVNTVQKFGFNSLLTNYKIHRNFASDSNPTTDGAQKLLRSISDDIVSSLELLSESEVKEMKKENGKRHKQAVDYESKPLSPKEIMKMHKRNKSGGRHRNRKRKTAISIAITCVIIFGFILFKMGLFPSLNDIAMTTPTLPPQISKIVNDTVGNTVTSIQKNILNNETSQPPSTSQPTIVKIPVPSVSNNQTTTQLTNPENPQTNNNAEQSQATSSTDNTYSHAELVAYALQLINSDRQNADLPPVELSDNQAAQVHAEDMLKVRTLSHYMTDGEKPYMVYTKYGGLGYVAQNAAFQGYPDISQCSNLDTICNAIDPKQAIQQAEYGMMNNDQASNWGHRDNILDKDHTNVSIGIAYDQYSFYMTQNFENNYIEYTKPISENNGIVSFSGSLSGGTVDNIEIAYDDLPTSSTYELHKNDGFYELGNYITNVQAPLPGNQYYQPSNNTFEVADKWNIQANSADISFDISPFVTKPGVYTIVVYLQNNGESIPVTSYSITKTSAMVPDGFKSPKVYYACTTTQLSQYNQLQQQYDTLKAQYDSRPKTATSDQEYQQDTQMYNQLNSLQNQLESFRC